MIYYDNDIIDWIKAHSGEDTNKLLLRYGSDDKLKFAIQQIICRKKTAKKLPSFIANDSFIFPTTLSAEQCTSEQAAAYHASLIPEGATVIDLTCGLGIDAFTIARRAASVTAYEQQQDIADATAHNAEVLGLKNFSISYADSMEVINSCNLSADIIFIDPARRDSFGKRVFGLKDCTPDVTAIMPRLFEIAPTVIIKASPMLDINYALEELSNVSRIIALGTSTECKELDIICQRVQEEPCSFSAVTITGNKSINEYNASLAHGYSDALDTPKQKHFLYEPYPAVMKLNHYADLSLAYDVLKCDYNSHLYFSDLDIHDFPGHKFLIKEVYPFNKESIRQITRKYDRLDVTCRNFPLSASELVTKLKLKSNSHLRLFATTCVGQRMLIISEACEP